MLEQKNCTKAPGPYGLSFLFYQTFWEVVKDDLVLLFNAFRNGQLDISKLNLASVCLIPKKEDALSITNFCPISLINCSFKIITKLLTNRLAIVMDPLIDDSQAAFIKGMLIGDNIVCAHEVLHQVRISKQQGVLFKLDFEKHLIESIGIFYYKCLELEVLVQFLFLRFIIYF